MNLIRKTKHIQELITSLWQGERVVLPSFDNPFELTKSQVQRDEFRSKFTESWMYYYLPLAASFGNVAPNISANRNPQLYSTSSPVKVDRLEHKKYEPFEYSCRSQEAIAPLFEPDALTLAEIFGEIWYQISSTVADQNHRVAELLADRKLDYRRDATAKNQNISPFSRLSFSGFRHENNSPDLVRIDLLSGWLVTSPCDMNDDKTSGSSRLCFSDPRVIGHLPPLEEFGGKVMNWNGLGAISDKEMWSMACFPAFYDERRCRGTILVSDKRDTWINDEFLINHETYYGNRPMSNEVRDALINGLLPLSQSFVASGTFGYNFKLMVVFGALSGDETSGLWASSACFMLGLRCFEDTAIAINKQLSSRIGVLQNELINLTARRAVQRLFEQNTELAREKARAESTAKELERNSKELKRSKQLLDLLQKPFETIAAQLNGALVDIQQLQGIYQVPARGIYERAHRANLRNMFKEGWVIKVCSQEFRISHSPGSYPDDALAHLVLLACICELIGISANDYASISSEEQLTDRICAKLFDREATDKEILTIVRGIVCKINDEPKWRMLIRQDPVRHLESVKSYLHTALKPSNSRSISVDQLVFALPRAELSALNWKNIPASSEWLLLLGQCNPYPTEAMLIESIAGLTGLNLDKVNDGDSLLIACECAEVQSDSDPKKSVTGKCHFVITRPKSKTPFLRVEATDSKAFLGLFGDKWRDWVKSHIDGTAGNTVEPIARAVSYAQTSEFDFTCEKLNGLRLFWRKANSSHLSIWIQPDRIDVISQACL